ncbi:MAG: HD domain-containing protein [Clostridia bacterium]
MEIVDKILKHPKFSKYLKLNAKAEKKRKFCRHDLQHAVDVARVACIIALENKFDLSKDMIYAAALLHDIAKWKQYNEKVDHAMEGAVLAKEILKDTGMNVQEAELILDAIRSHRTIGENNSPLSMVLYTGDKACRLCIQCGMIDECNRFEDGKQPDFQY